VQSELLFLGAVPDGPIRIFSDIHYGDRASQVSTLAQLRPLLDSTPGRLVLNGDTLDSRAGPDPAYTAACLAEVRAFFSGHHSATTYLTGNHDPTISSEHVLELAEGRVLVTHGDIAFGDIVPWGRDRHIIEPRIDTELAQLGPAERDDIDRRFAIWRRVAAEIPQRHQSERNLAKYIFRYALDTVWPPQRTLIILRAWREHRYRMARLAREHWPRAKYVLVGHTHRPGIWRMREGVTVINTGSFCPPTGGYLVDVESSRLVVRQLEQRAGEFRPGRTVAELPL
jgi:predicted phosphodiesterase